MNTHVTTPHAGEQPNIANAKWFLLELFGPNAPVTIRLVWQKAEQFKPAGFPNAHTFHNPSDADWWNISLLNVQGYSVFFFVNELDGSGGTSDSNVVRIRANFVDLDNTSTARAMAEMMISDLHPSLIVQSSPEKFHLYLRTSPHADGAVSRLMQQKLAARYDGDRSICNPARIMRLPGFLHQKGAPFLVPWQAVQGGQHWTPEALAAALQGVQVAQEGADGARQPLGTLMQASSREWLQAAMDAIDPNDLTREEWSRVYWAFMQAGWGVCQPEELRAMLDAWCARYVRPWGSGEGQGNKPHENHGLWLNAERHGTSAGLPTILRAVGAEARPALEAELRRFDPAAAFGGMQIALPGQIEPKRRLDFLDHDTSMNTHCKPVSQEAYRIIRDAQLPVGFDEFKNKIAVRDQLPWEVSPARKYPRDWTDMDDAFLKAYMQSTPGMARIAKGEVIDGLLMYVDRNKFNSVIDYLNGLQWDEKPRLNELFTHYFNAENADFARLVGPKFLIGMVARAMQPGCKRDEMVILEGEQGAKKSTALNILAGDEYFSDNLPDLRNKDALLQLQGMWLIEIGELSALRKSEIEDVKRFITSKTDKFRQPYGRNVADYPRTSVFAGTTNNDTYLKDPTGARRFWPVACGQIDLDALRRDREQLFAEAVARYRAGERWWLDGDAEQALARGETEQRQERDVWHDDVMGCVARLEMFKANITVELIMADALHMNTPNLKDPRSTGRIAAILRSEGYKKKQLSLPGRPRVYVKS
ncbi:VapE domain-containing protein [Paracoccus yeei]|uniref:VapE domain-containing protein n=1 Tax=Paracoccus yeei TaxID=147645 RepID=UPI003BF8BB78